MLQVQLAFSSKMKKLSSLLVLFCSIVLILHSYQATSHDEVAGRMNKSEWSTYVTSKRLVADAFVFLRSLA